MPSPIRLEYEGQAKGVHFVEVQGYAELGKNTPMLRHFGKLSAGKPSTSLCSVTLGDCNDGV